jgi:hypothetical protein
VRSSTAGLRFHDVRYHAITELAESQTSDQTVMGVAGHASLKMLAHYSHVRVEAKRKALVVLSGGGGESGCGTNHDANSSPITMPHPQVVARIRRPVQTRTADLYRVKVAPTNTYNNA